MDIANSTRMAAMKDRVFDRLLPQSCEISVPTDVVTPAGFYSATSATLVEYAGSTTIPVRLVRSLHYRQADVEEQEVTVSEFKAYLPRDIGTIQVNSLLKVEGKVYEIRKILDDQAWDVITQVLLVRVNSGADPIANTNPPVASVNLLLESGDVLLLETGDNLIGE